VLQNPLRSQSRKAHLLKAHRSNLLPKDNNSQTNLSSRLNLRKSNTFAQALRLPKRFQAGNELHFPLFLYPARNILLFADRIKPRFSISSKLTDEKKMSEGIYDMEK
jgi:hypothetical protein